MNLARRDARFRRADLQMQTPIDRQRWRGASLEDGGAGLGDHPTDADIDESARRYAARCAEADLDIVAITDHNLGGPDLLVQQYHDALHRHLPDHITMFPGFEVATSIGKGAHFLCLFEPGTAVDELSQVLAQLELPAQRRFEGTDPLRSSKQFNDLHRIVCEQHGGLLVAAHASRASGLGDDDTIDTDWQRDVIQDGRLLAIELPATPEKCRTQNNKAGLIARNEGDWHRDHPLSILNDSDCKRLHEHDSAPGTGRESWIGKRWTWIKTAPEVSIESLRQAFLDPASRLAHPTSWASPGNPPDQRPGQRRVDRIWVKDAAFLADQEIDFSPQLTCIIGGGGAGKSTVVEYLRLAMGVEQSGPSAAAIRGTITPSTSIHATLWDGTKQLKALLRRGTLSVYDDEGEEVGDVTTRFPVRYVGQRQLFEIASDAGRTRSLIDSLVADELARLAAIGRRLQTDLEAVDAARRRHAQSTARLSAVTEQVARRRAERDAHQALLNPIAQLDDARVERRTIEGVRDSIGHAISALNDTADGLTLPVSLAELAARNTPHRVAIESAHAQAQGALNDAASAIRAVAEKLTDELGTHVAPVEATVDEWFATAQTAYETARTEAGPVPPSDFTAELDALDIESKELERDIEGTAQMLATEQPRLEQLRMLWAEETLARRRAAERLAASVPTVGAGSRQPFVTVDVDAFGDVAAAVAQVCSLLADRRAFGDADADDLLRALTDTRKPDEDPVALLRNWLAHPDKAPAWFRGLTAARYKALAEVFVARPEMARYRTPDAVTVTVFRDDGNRVGTLADGLSIGQKCMAILSLMLAVGDDPIIIDQPEEEMDNEFIYTELVPLIRAAKQQRQVIVVTHNANIPVNGDAELIIALQARADEEDPTRSRGRQKRVAVEPGTPGGDLAVGPLEYRAVRLAVEEIMEGSEQAFRRRLAKYGF